MSWFMRFLLPTASLLEAGGRWLLSLLRSFGRWLRADWRNGPLVVCAAMWAAHALLLAPAYRDRIAAAEAALKSASEIHQETIKGYRKAVTEARRRAEQNVARVETEQAGITQEIIHDFEARLADARARAARIYRTDGSLHGTPTGGAAGGSAGAAGLPGVPAAPGRAGAPAGEDRLPAAGRAGGTLNPPDALIATEQALQLQALIAWVTRQAAVQVVPEDAAPGAGHQQRELP